MAKSVAHIQERLNEQKRKTEELSKSKRSMYVRPATTVEKSAKDKDLIDEIDIRLLDEITEIESHTSV